MSSVRDSYRQVVQENRLRLVEAEFMLANVSSGLVFTPFKYQRHKAASVGLTVPHERKHLQRQQLD